MKYNVGDRVLIQSREWYEVNKNIFGKVWTKDLTGDGVICFDHDMAEYCGQEFIIEAIEDDCYALRGVPYAWTDEMFEDVECQGFAFRLPEDLRNERLVVTRQHGYEFRDENGKVINASKIVLEKKKEYPKTYEECCYVLGFENTEMIFEDYYRDIDPPEEQWKRLGLINRLNKLLICRDAYWKLYGEEIGLGKPWEPDWKNEDNKFIIQTYDNEVGCWSIVNTHRIFAFPTPEMRDAFKENFDPDIEICKEFL